MIPFFTELSMKRRLELMKKAGFNTFMMSLDRGHEKFTATLEEIVELCKKIDLEIETGHAPYKDPDVNTFWSEDKEGDIIEEMYMESLRFASKHNIKNVVFHMHFENDYELNEAGIKRLKRMVKYAEENNVNVAVENLYSYKELEYIFQAIKSPNLGMCFDSGHENFLTKNADFLHKFGNRLKAVHLHDNNGIKDEHKTPFTGTINWKNIANGFAKANKVSLESEVRLYRPENKQIITEEELFALYKREFKALQKLEKLIEKEKDAMEQLTV